MPTNAPPFPVAHSPHLDIIMRELYARMTGIERLLRTVTPGAPTAMPTLKVSEAILVQMANVGLGYSDGWWNSIPTNTLDPSHIAFGRGPQFLANLDAPGVVLSISGYLLEVFESRDRDVVITDFGTTITTPYERKEFWGEVDADAVNGSGWVGSQVIIEERMEMPAGPGPRPLWRNIGVLHTSRKAWGRPGIDVIVWLPIVVAFRWGTPPQRAAARDSVASAAVASGKLHFLAVYSEGLFKSWPVPLAEIRRHVLFSELGVKAA